MLVCLVNVPRMFGSRTTLLVRFALRMCMRFGGFNENKETIIFLFNCILTEINAPIISSEKNTKKIRRAVGEQTKYCELTFSPSLALNYSSIDKFQHCDHKK
jgi:hypothetical protein